MKYKLVVTSSTATPDPTTDEDQTTQQQLHALKALSEGLKCDTELANQAQLHIGDKSIAEIVNAIKAVLGNDTSTTVLVPNGKKLEEAGVVTIVVETGKEMKVVVGEEKNGKEDQDEKAGKEVRIVSSATGSFNSTELRGWWRLGTCDWKEVSFFGLGDKAMDGGAAADKMDVLVGLNWLDFHCWRNLRIRGFSERQNNDSGNIDNFKIKLETWADSFMHSCGCNWIALPHTFASAARIHYGSFNTTEDHAWYHPQTVTTRDITFVREYTEEEGVPNVAIWFNSLDISKGNEMFQVRTWASDITRRGFKINIVCKESTTLWSAEVSWLSYPKGRKAIDSARFETTRSLGGWSAKSESGKIAFKDRIMSQVFVGLNELEAGGWANSRVNMTAKAGVEEVGWKVETWADSVVRKAGGTVIILGELTGSTPLKYIYQ